MEVMRRRNRIHDEIFLTAFKSAWERTEHARMTNDFRHDERLLAKVSASAWDVAQRVTLEIEDYLFEQEEEDRETLARQLASQRNGKEAE